MYVASIPYFPTDKRTYEIDEIRPGSERVMMELYPEIYSCIGCNSLYESLSAGSECDAVISLDCPAWGI